MGPRFGDPALPEHDDPVGEGERRQSVGHNESGPVRGHFPDGANDGVAGLHVHLADGVVQQQDGRFPEEGPGQGDPLLLPAGQDHPPLPHDGVQPLGERPDGVGNRGPVQGLPELVLGHGFVFEGDVLPDGSGEQKRLLGDEGDEPPEIRQRAFPSVHAAHGHRPFLGVVEPGDEVEQRRLPGPRRTDDPQGSAPVHTEVDSLQGRNHAAVFIIG